MWRGLKLPSKGIGINSGTDRKAGKISGLIILHKSAAHYIIALN